MDEVDRFYASLLGSTNDHAFTLDLDALELPSSHLEHLEGPISEEEVWEVGKAMPSDKLQGPDGFTGRFYKTCWPIIKHDS